jgi:hypothetical protein
VLERIRWSNVARLVFVLAGLALVVGGLPHLGGGAKRVPELGLPDEVLRPRPAGESQTVAQHPPPIRRIVQRSRREGPRPRAKPRRRSARPARRVPPVTAVPAPPAPTPGSPPAVGEFGP